MQHQQPIIMFGHAQSVHDAWGHDMDCDGDKQQGMPQQQSMCWSTSEEHCTQMWADCFPAYCLHVNENPVENTFLHRRDQLAEIMLGVLPPALGGDICDWERGDESETTVHNMVSTSVVHSNRMPINLSHLAMMLPCSTYDRKRFAAITIRIDNPRCTALLFTSGKLVITGVKSWWVVFYSF